MAFELIADHFSYLVFYSFREAPGKCTFVIKFVKNLQQKNKIERKKHTKLNVFSNNNKIKLDFIIYDKDVYCYNAKLYPA